MNTEAVLVAMSENLIEELESRYEANCYRAGVPVSDVVGDAYGYVVSSILNGARAMPETREDLYRLVSGKAHRLFLDAYRSLHASRGKRSVKPTDYLDKKVGESERELTETASVISWKECNCDEEKQYRYRICRMVLERVCELRKIGEMNKRIYRAAVLCEQSREAVALRFGTTRNNVDQIIYRVKKGLQEDGMNLYRELYEKAA